MFDAAVPCRGAACVGVTTFGRKAQNGEDGEKSATDGRSASRERPRPASGSLPRDIAQSVAAGPPRPHPGHSGPAATDCARSLSRARIAHADDVPHSPPLGCRRSGRRGPPDRLHLRGGGPCPTAEPAGNRRRRRHGRAAAGRSARARPSRHLDGPPWRRGRFRNGRERVDRPVRPRPRRRPVAAPRGRIAPDRRQFARRTGAISSPRRREPSGTVGSAVRRPRIPRSRTRRRAMARHRGHRRRWCRRFPPNRSLAGPPRLLTRRAPLWRVLRFASAPSPRAARPPARAAPSRRQTTPIIVSLPSLTPRCHFLGVFLVLDTAHSEGCERNRKG